jgi:FAD/FMN-containing dehydrogenase
MQMVADKEEQIIADGAFDKGTVASDAKLAAAVHGLAGRLLGRLIDPDDADYDTARAVRNGRIDRRPALIVMATDAEDVAEVVRFARTENLPLSVRGGGHNILGHAVCDGGVVLDMTRMKGLVIDPAARTVRAEAGLTMGEVFRTVHAHGFILTVGSHDSVGVAGITLAGGMGVLMGKYGLISDNLLSAEVVTADGRRLTASEAENPDLFWAIRGGGGNFGVVTSLTFRLYPIEPVTIAGVVFHPVERVREVLGFYRDYTRDLPDEVGALFAIMTGPGGMPVCGIMACYTGASAEEGERLVAPLREFGPPVMAMLGPAPYTVLLDMLKDTDPAGHHYAFASRGLSALTDEALDAIAAHGAAMTSPGSVVVLYHLHGEAARRAPDATAFAQRNVPYFLGAYAGWEPGGEAAPHIAWRDGVIAAVAPHSTGTGYLGVTGDTGEAAVRALYGDNYARLARVKAAYDPENVFRHNHNILPDRR